jgi:hypothetical protein
MICVIHTADQAEAFYHDLCYPDQVKVVKVEGRISRVSSM